MCDKNTCIYNINDDNEMNAFVQNIGILYYMWYEIRILVFSIGVISCNLCVLGCESVM